MPIQRNALNALQKWKTSPLRKPLLIHGARQVGKSYLVRQFGQSFENFIEINFEKDKQAKKLFEDQAWMIAASKFIFLILV